MTSIYAVTNQKGGVGKSATTCGLARAASRSGLRTLVIDADPQGNTSSALLEDLDADALSLADVLAPNSDTPLTETVVPTIWEGVWLVPAGGDNLAAVEQLLVAVTAGRESRLRQALSQTSHEYDLVLIDCNPSIGLLTTNALVAATHALVVTKPEKWALDGFGRLYHSLLEIQNYYNPLLRLAGVVVNNVTNTNQSKFWLQELLAQAASAELNVLEPFIPRRQLIADALEAQRGLDELGQDGREIAELYTSLLNTITTEA